MVFYYIMIKRMVVIVNCQDILEFKGSWRNYQQKVLDQLDIMSHD